MKNVILKLFLVLMLVGMSDVQAKDVSCQAQVDQEIKKLNLGSFDKPLSCGEKIEVHRPGDAVGSKFRFSVNNREMPQIYYTEKSDLNTSGGPYVRIAETDLYGNFVIKDIHYDPDCKVNKVYFRTTSADGSQHELTLNQATCINYGPNKNSISTEDQLVSKNAVAHANCLAYGIVKKADDSKPNAKPLGTTIGK